jgi:hypothetical protein
MRWEAEVGAKKWYREEGEKQNGHRNSKICAKSKRRDRSVSDRHAQLPGAAQEKLKASLGSPEPLYLADCG